MGAADQMIGFYRERPDQTAFGLHYTGFQSSEAFVLSTLA
jgi:hypothetical protein